MRDFIVEHKRNMSRFSGIICLSLIFSFACKQNAESEAPKNKVQSQRLENQGEVHRVTCACKLEKPCANMIEVEGKFIPLKGDIGLDEMAFCGKENLKAKVVGAKKEDYFEAMQFELIQEGDQ